MPEDDKQILVDLLIEASKLEHCLLDAYLYTAAAMKSTPQEFAQLDDGRDNRRRAIQFERARLWKQVIFEITHEEMLHLHYVQTLLRSLGVRPSFALPDRDPTTGTWVMPDWRAKLGTDPVDGGQGVHIPVEGPTLDNLRRFVLYEATDALQDLDPFGAEARTLFRSLADLELSLRLETMLLNVPDDKADAARVALSDLYAELLPADAADAPPLGADQLELAGTEAITFQSIADLYNEQIVPRFQQAFDEGWVREADRDVVNELQGPDAAEGFLPVKDVYRDKNFEKQSESNTQRPLIGIESVDDIIKEIVEEGEGATDFVPSARALLAKVEEIGTKAYIEAVLADEDPDTETPPWFAQGQLVRTSHLYRFAILLAGIEDETELCRRAGTTFEPARRPLTLAPSSPLEPLAGEVSQQFNACYLVLVSWLSRMYEIQDWLADKPRRLSIEMLASWPLMSMGIRPLLELASFLPVDRRSLFRLEDAWMPSEGPSRELLALWQSPDRSQDLVDQMDALAVSTLARIAEWADGWRPVVADGDEASANASAMMTARLEELGHLQEFAKEFPFRTAGGYSDRVPDLTYVQLHPNGPDYTEDPTMWSGPSTPGTAPPLFKESLVLRVRFAGWGLVQLATDPDPTFDESGVTGTHMLHAADGDRRFNRALVWQVEDPATTIDRGPRGVVPPLGVDVVDAALCVVPAEGTAAYAPLQVLNSTGAVQASGLQQVVQLQGIDDVLVLPGPTLTAGGTPIRLTLRSKDGAVPALNGLNHVVSQDGEAIDPFILSMSVDGTNGSTPLPLFQREVFNTGKTFLDMSPLQRLDSARRPSFDGANNVPDWARNVVPEDFRSSLGGPDFASSWLLSRAEALGGALVDGLGAHGGEDSATAWTQGDVDEVISLAERLVRINLPSGTTVGWLGALLHYGHTVSGPQVCAEPNPVLSVFESQTGIPLALRDGDRGTNGRWLANYSLGVMDTDSIRNLVYGEVHIPVMAPGGAGGVKLQRTWDARADMAQVLADVTCHFDRPFWGAYEVNGMTRTTTLPDKTRITDTLDGSADAAGYGWTMTGIPDLVGFHAELVVTPGSGGSGSRLTFHVAFSAGSEAACVAGVGVFAWIAGAIPGAVSDTVSLVRAG
jgi:Ferritin-like